MESSWDRIAPYELPPTTALGMAVIGTLVRQRRRAVGLSQRQLASRVGLNQSTISRLENGRLRTFRLVRLADVFGVLDDPLLGETPPLTRWS